MSVSLSSPSLSMHAGDRVTLTGTCTLGGTLTWTTSDPLIAVVSNGIVIAIRNAGIASITATSSAGGNASCAVNVQGISTSYVASLIGFGSSDVQELCANSRNKWSLFKPIIFASLYLGDNIYNIDSYRNNGAGMTIPAFQGAMSFGDFLDAMEVGGEDAYVYNKPTGGLASPYRLEDYRGYKNSGKPKIGMYQERPKKSANIYFDAPNNVSIPLYDNWEKLVVEKGGDNIIELKDIYLDNVTKANIDDLYLTAVFVGFGQAIIQSLVQLKNLTYVNGKAEYEIKSHAFFSDANALGGTYGIINNIKKQSCLPTLVGPSSETSVPMYGLVHFDRYYILTTKSISLKRVSETQGTLLPLEYLRLRTPANISALLDTGSQVIDMGNLYYLPVTDAALRNYAFISSHDNSGVMTDGFSATEWWPITVTNNSGAVISIKLLSRKLGIGSYIESNQEALQIAGNGTLYINRVLCGEDYEIKLSSTNRPFSVTYNSATLGVPAGGTWNSGGVFPLTYNQGTGILTKAACQISILPPEVRLYFAGLSTVQFTVDVYNLSTMQLLQSGVGVNSGGSLLLQGAATYFIVVSPIDSANPANFLQSSVSNAVSGGVHTASYYDDFGDSVEIGIINTDLIYTITTNLDI